MKLWMQEVLQASMEGHTGLQPGVNSSHSWFFKEPNIGTQTVDCGGRKLTAQLCSFTNNKEKDIKNKEEKTNK